MLQNPENIDLYNIKTLLARLKTDSISVTPSVVEGASAEDSSAYLVIGEKYLEMREYKKAMSWFMLGAWKNHPQCMFMIGYFYENGIFVARNVEIAMDWYIKSVSRSHQQALFQMDKLCQNGSYSKLVSKMLKVLGQRIEKDKKRIDEFNIFMYLRAIEIRERTRQLDELMGGSIVNANLIAERFSEEDMNYLVNEQVHIIQGYNHLLEQKKRINDDINEILLYENIIEVLADLVYI